MSVDLPAPLGPMIPTRLRARQTLSEHTKPACCETHASHLDNDRAQLTPIRLGSFRPGYVNVQLASLRIARVLLRTPISEPGGGNANLTEVAARV